MALTKCRGCKHEISRDAPMCPFCGKPQRKSKGIGCGVILLLVIFAAITSSTNSKKDPSPTATPSTTPTLASGNSTMAPAQPVVANTPAATPQITIPTRPAEPIWTDRLIYWRTEYAKQFTAPVIGQQIEFVLQGGTAKRGKLIALTPGSFTIEISNGSLTYDRNSIRQDSRVQIFAADYAEGKALKAVATEKSKYAETIHKYEELVAATRAAEAERIRAEQQGAKKAQFEKLLSSWDGSLSTLVRYTKDSMNDPKSFDHVETRYRIDGDGFVVRMEFRGKNAFGALVKNAVTAKVAADGNIQQIISTDL